MDFKEITRGRRWLIPAILVVFMAVAFLIRAVPALSMGNMGFLHISDTDSWYTLRQIEVMVHQFPQYNWFDPMTSFPQGKVIDWGPLYPVAASVLCIVTGSTTHAAIVSMSGWVSPLMGVAMVPVAYYLGKTIRDELTGVIAAGLIAVVSYQYFFLSSYGLVDHHIAEVLFTSLFIITYLSSLARFRDNSAGIRDYRTWLRPVSLAVLAGVFWFLSIVTSTTVLVILMIAGFYTIAQNIFDIIDGRRATYLLAVNLFVTVTAAALLLASGILQETGSITQYSYATVYVLAIFAAGSLVLFAATEVIRKKHQFSLIVIAGLATLFVALAWFIPVLRTIVYQAFSLFFGSAEFTLSVQETLPWSWGDAITNFNVALILAAAGFIVLCYIIQKKREGNAIFLAIWSVILLAITIGHQRFEYYLTVPLVLLSALCIATAVLTMPESLTRQVRQVISRASRENADRDGEKTGVAEHSSSRNKAAEKGKGKNTSKNSPKHASFSRILKKLAVPVVLILTIILVGHAVFQDYAYGGSIGEAGTLSPDWTDSLDWLASGTPSPGVDYFQHYDPTGFSYPHEAYGIMAAWDAGHWITFFSHRLPITNPFQDNLAGKNGAAAYFLATNESGANEILKGLGGKYVVTNSEMAVDTFTGLAPWADPSADISPYIKWFLAQEPQNPAKLVKVHKFDDGYFQTMVARLNNFDGSLNNPDNVSYIRYAVRQVPGPGEDAGDVKGYARVISSDSHLDVSQGLNASLIDPEGAALAPKEYANVFSDLPTRAIRPVPALEHYRLVHESPDDAVVIPFPESVKIILPGIKQVKIFEFVQGARIPGYGIIEVPLVTNTGRTFIYRQESTNGEFVVPYSTTGNPYGVKTTGPYHVAGTDRFYTVSEEDVTGGATIIQSHNG